MFYGFKKQKREVRSVGYILNKIFNALQQFIKN